MKQKHNITNLWNATKAIPRGKFAAINTCMNKKNKVPKNRFVGLWELFFLNFHAGDMGFLLYGESIIYQAA